MPMNTRGFARGVLQGSILGPTLYTVYMRDLSTMIKFRNARMNASDAQFLIHIYHYNLSFKRE